MKKLLLPAVIALAVLNLNGCMKVDSHTEINGDGSGTATLTMSISPDVLEAITEMQKMDSGQSQSMDFPLFEDLNGDKIKQAAEGQGVELKKFEKTLVDGRQTLNVVLDFDDLKGFSYVMGSIMGDGQSNDGIGIFAAADGNFILRQAQYDFPPREIEEVAEETESETPSAEMDPQQMQKQMELMGKLMGSLSELDVAFRFTVPGDIVKTNAPQTDGRTSIWAINASNMMTMDQDMDPEITFAGKGLKIKPLKE